jgi:membrane associated rhomboid family serine protease
MVLAFTALELVSMITGRAGNVAHITHLAGFGIGWLYLLIRLGLNPIRAWRR